MNLLANFLVMGNITLKVVLMLCDKLYCFVDITNYYFQDQVNTVKSGHHIVAVDIHFQSYCPIVS